METEQPASAPTKRSLGSRLIAILVAVAGLWWLWSGDEAEPVPEAPVARTLEAVKAMEAGQTFWFEGWVEPADPENLELWKGRFAYREAAGEKDEWGSRNMVVEREVKPEIVFRWEAGARRVPAESYDLSEAPYVTRGINDHSRGFVSGDPAVAIGKVGFDGNWSISSLAQGPADRLLAARLDVKESRGKIALFLRLGGTLLLAVIGIRALQRH